MDYPHIHPNNAAFPVPSGAETGGISIREYYAGMMMQAMLSRRAEIEERFPSLNGYGIMIKQAELSVDYADYLIEALNKNPVT